MFGGLKRILAVGVVCIVLAGCRVVPAGESSAPEPAGPVAAPPPGPSAAVLPEDRGRHRVALLVPMSGENADVGQSIANATTMALLDTGAEDLRITTYDTGGGAGAAAARAVADGNKLILGPLQRDHVAEVLAQARAANVPLLTFSNDTTVARSDVFVMGHVPEQSVARSVDYAIDNGARNFAILAPRGDYGNRTAAAAEAAVEERLASVVAVERYDRGNASITAAADRLVALGGYDTVLIADSASQAAVAAPRLRAGARQPRLIGTELWSRQNSLLSVNQLRGAWFSSVSDDRYDQFAVGYEARFGTQPFRIATLGYDAVLLTRRLARDWQPGSNLPARLLLNEGGFLGLDGPIRFSATGIGERAMEVRQVGSSFTVVSAAPTGF